VGNGYSYSRITTECALLSLSCQYGLSSEFGGCQKQQRPCDQARGPIWWRLALPSLK